MISRAWAMPNKRTFSIKPIKEMAEKYGLEPCFDVFPFGDEIDVLARIKKVPDASRLTVIFDPPFSPRQAKECYGINAVRFTSLVRQLKDEVARITAPSGHVISCGWNSNGMGKGRGFVQVEIKLVAHGGSHNDTIVTVERKS